MTAALTARQSAAESPRYAERDLEAAVAADPYSVTPCRELAAWRYARWQANPTAENWASVATALEEELQRAPQSAIGWQHAGGWYLEAYRRLGDEALLRAATDSLEKAVELFPNSSTAHADLAEALDVARDEPPAREHAKLALELDDITPHLDLKLQEARRAEMERIASGDSAKE
jgi:cytochrome c-type biogenesis protein CcmH/NrfG